MYDFHIHSEHSMDSTESMEKITLSAMDKNLKSICFTDHVDFSSTNQKIDVSFREADYFRNIKQVKYKYANNIEILSGVEIGMQPHLSEQYNYFIGNNPFDFVIMSIRSIDKVDISDGDLISKMDPSEVLERYYMNMLKSIQVFNNFDVIGHFDYIDKFLLKYSKVPKYDDYYNLIEEILQILIDKGKGIELNTSGMLSDLNSFYPKVEILSLYKKLGGEIITIGSNAHKAENVGYQYRTGEKLLKELGFNHIYIFKDRKKYPINLR